jgi:crotonobetainyl-CoA:carnitine CoA-transferase CaiB-like acyl-CoA transferase
MYPLEGLKVVELARVLAGPWIGQTLADLGAEVIKVESPEGDDTRKWGPNYVTKGADSSAAYFHSTNRGKQGITVDFNDAGQGSKPCQIPRKVQRQIAHCEIPKEAKCIRLKV